MDSTESMRSMQFRLGLMIIAGFIMLGTLIYIFSDWKSLCAGDSYPIQIEFDSAPNVKENTPVRRSGVLIGRVSKVHLTTDGVIISANIQKAFEILDNQVCQLSQNILGDAVLDFIPRTLANGQIANANGTPIQLPLKEPLKGICAPNLMTLAATMQEKADVVINSITKTSDNINKLLVNCNNLVDGNGDDDIVDTFHQLKAIANQAETLLKTTNQLVSDPEIQKGLKDTIRMAPDTFTQMREAFAQAKIALSKMDGLANNINKMTDSADETLGKINSVVEKTEKSVTDINKITGPISEKTDIWLVKLGRALDNLDGILLQVNTFTTTLNESDGTVNKLVKDPTLYNNLNSTVQDLKELTASLDPIIRNMEVFSDKVARHPESLGVRGALERQAGTKGAPPIPKDLQGEFQKFRDSQLADDNIIYYQPQSSWEGAPGGRYAPVSPSASPAVSPAGQPIISPPISIPQNTAPAQPMPTPSAYSASGNGGLSRPMSQPMSQSQPMSRPNYGTAASGSPGSFETSSSRVAELNPPLTRQNNYPVRNGNGAENAAQLGVPIVR